MTIRVKGLFVSGCAVLGMALAAPAWAGSAAASAAPSAPACVAGKPTAASYTWDFKAEAARTLNDIRADARQISEDADTLRWLTLNPGADWGLQEEQLGQMKRPINDIVSDVCRLETIRRVVSPPEQHEIDLAIAEGTLLSIHAQDAYNWGNQHPEDLLLGPYRSDVANLYNEASALQRSVGSAQGAS